MNEDEEPRDSLQSLLLMPLEYQFSNTKTPTFNFSEPHDFAATHKKGRNRQFPTDFQGLSATPFQLDGPWEGRPSSLKGKEHIELAKFTRRQGAEARGSRCQQVLEESKECLETNEQIGYDVKQ